ncbi:hypothetical protein PHYC_00870 [Phycisphaerales bacterium]|nr:hypothetical protein PHYC_00870 [Phycisphaerales bacterium]
MSLSTTRLSSKGQVVLPGEVRDRLGLRTGSRFIVIADGDTVILKLLKPPTAGELQGLLARARAEARKAGVMGKDISRAVRRVRRSA